MAADARAVSSPARSLREECEEARREDSVSQPRPRERVAIDTPGGVRLLRFRRRKGRCRGVLLLNTTTY